MKASFTAMAFAAFAFITFSGMAQKQGVTPAAYIGTWKLVSASQTRGDSTNKYDSTTIAEYKVITPGWFMYTIFEKKSNTFIGSSSGKLTITGDQMANTAEYSSFPNRQGITNTYTVDVKGNILHQKGKNLGVELEEFWVRIH